MEGIIQATSSQPKSLDPRKKNVVDKVKNTKPPLLPKPQRIKDQRTIFTDQIPSAFLTKDETLPTKAYGSGPVSFPIQNGETLGSKSPVQSLKPQIPPKTFALNSLKSEIFLTKLTPSQRFDPFPKQSPLSESTSIKQSQKNGSKNENDTAVPKKGTLNYEALPKNLVLSQNIGSGLCRNEDHNWNIKDLFCDSKELSEFCKEVENCSKHSHILRAEGNPPLPDKWSKKKVINDSTDLDISNAKVEGRIKSYSDVMKCYNFAEDNAFKDITLCSIGEKRKQLENNLGQNQDSLSNVQSCVNSNVPKSFLHKYVSTYNQTKDSVKCDEMVPEKIHGAESFLYKNKAEVSSKLNKTSLDGHDLTAGCANWPKNSKEDNDKDYVASKDHLEQSDAPKKSENSDTIPFSKRFLWFGSFGKGNKKESIKKGRCFSQFYSSPAAVDEQSLLREKSRTKSLPDIKQTRVTSEGSIDLKSNEELARNFGSMGVSGEYTHSDSDDDKDSLNQIEFASDKDSNTLAFLKAKELMTSEEVFIDVLKLLNVDFRNYIQSRNLENKSACIPNGEVDKILNHLSQLQSLNEDILEDLRGRIKNWEKNPKIADVIVKKGAFLKMYTTYIQHFECQTNYLDECVMKYPKFGKIVREFEATDRCKKLSLKHYMLKPVQRIPQYRLLLNDYLKHLNETSEDYLDTLSALKIVCEVVDHANRNVSHGDKEGRLIHFQSLLSDFELIKPGRELIKDGPLVKICRKTVKDRYFILLNDCLLHTTYSKQYLKIHQELPLSGMKICINGSEKSPSFTVHSITKSFILCAKSETECKDWVEVLQKTIDEHIKRQKTFLNVKIEQDMSFKLGKEAPVWVQDSKVTMCQICTAEFTALFRRHHCRGCGKVVCRNCGSNQAPLQYRNFKPDRVCDLCFELLLKDYEDSEASVCECLKEMLNSNEEAAQNEYLSVKAKFIKYTSASNWKKQKYIPPRLKEVSANDSRSIISGWLYRKSRKSWKLFWYVLKDHVLYVYKASEDVLALETIPILGYEVEWASVNYEDVDRKLVFSLVHPCQTPITFRAESYAAAERWFDALTAATNLDYLTL